MIGHGPVNLATVPKLSAGTIREPGGNLFVKE
jgi:hypothetical protein